MRELVNLFWDYLSRHHKLQILFILLGGFGLVSLGFMAWEYIKKRFLGWMFLPARLLPVAGFFLFILRSQNNPGELPLDLVAVGFAFAVAFSLLIEGQYRNFKAGKPIGSPVLIVVCGLGTIVLAAIEIRQVFGIEVWSFAWQWGKAVIKWLLKP